MQVHPFLAFGYRFELNPPLWRNPAYRKLKQENADKIFHDLIKRDGPQMDIAVSMNQLRIVCSLLTRLLFIFLFKMHPKNDPLNKLLYRKPVFEKLSQKITNKLYFESLAKLRSDSNKFDTHVSYSKPRPLAF